MFYRYSGIHMGGDAADAEEYSRVFWQTGIRVAILDYFNLDFW